MKKKFLIILLVFGIIFIISAGLGGFLLWENWPATWSREPPILEFPLENPNVIHILGGYGPTPWMTFHPGIDFGVNSSVNIIASCNLLVTYIKTWLYATDPDRWQTSVGFNINWQYSLEIAFESCAFNETFANLQRDEIPLTVRQIIPQGLILGKLLYHGSGAHIHFMLKKSSNSICPYLYFSDSAKILFDELWAKYGASGVICGDNTTLCSFNYY